RNNTETISPVKNPHTIAHAIENPFPPSGNEVLKRIKKNNGTFVAVTDGEIIQAQKQLLKTGIFAQPSSAVPLAAVKKLKAQTFFNENDSVVCIITGGGLKDSTIFKNSDLNIINSGLEYFNDLPSVELKNF
ncbi:MAG: pyridoxal-phosphate dependent enzyme, partial [Dehalococcoidales bacterium]|nr:pyridoxal-phosphate dependent enzyme [Dehalococcoidales bacterium]